tara:strand:+ start:173 stop:454 length:282 start_codon:yes stop_codon:yes gene_type:complete
MKKSIITVKQKAQFSDEQNEDWESMHESNWASVDDIIKTLKEYEYFFKNFELGRDNDSTLIHYRNRMRNLVEDLKSDSKISKQELDFFDMIFE